MRVIDSATRFQPGVPYELLLAISEQTNQSVGLQDLVRHLLEAVRSVVEYDAAGIFVLNRAVPVGAKGGAFDSAQARPDLIGAMATVGFDHLVPGRDPMLRSGKGIIGHVIRTGETVVASDVRDSPHYVEARPETRSEVAIPIVTNAQVIGALNLESNSANAFSDEDAELLQAFATAAAIGIEKARLHQEVVEKHLMDQQLRIAREVQGGLLPGGAPSIAGYDIAGLNVPAWDIGGDYYDYLSLDDDRLGLVVADVSGKGVPAALLMATFRAALRSEARRNRSIDALVADVHRTLSDSMDDSHYVTTVYGELDRNAGTFSYANCGHNPPLLVQANGAWRRLPASGRAIGMFGFESIAASTVSLDPGDVLVLYTDGVVEACDPDSTEFGEARIARVVAESAARPARDIVNSLVRATRLHTGREHYEDDFTVVVLKRLAQ